MKEITRNKKAFFDYEILETQQAGIELRGHEVKSIRSGQVHLKGAYISSLGQEMMVKGMHISPWKFIGNIHALEPDRPRKILLHKKTILAWKEKSKQTGLTILPLSLYFEGGLIKMQVGLARGRKSFQKKQVLKERTLQKEAKKMLLKSY